MIAARVFFALLTAASIAGLVANLPEPREAVLAWGVCAIVSFTAFMREIARDDDRVAKAALKMIEAQQEIGRAIGERLVAALDIVSSCANDAAKMGRAESP